MFFLDKGGELTLHITGKGDQLDNGRPSSEPLYSLGNRDEFPIPERHRLVKYYDFIYSIIMNNDKMLISQSIYHNYLSAVFARNERYTAKDSACWKGRSYGELLECVERKRGFRIYSLAADDATGMFFMYMLQGYGGRDQSIITELSDIEEKWKEGKKITCCTSLGDRYYIVMTENVVGSQGKQFLITHSSWPDVESMIEKYYKEGKIITALCYNVGRQEYLVVMATSRATQSFEWRRHSGSNGFDISMEDEEEDNEKHITLVFKDPKDNRNLVVRTSDKHRDDGSTAAYWDFPLLGLDWD